MNLIIIEVPPIYLFYLSHYLVIIQSAFLLFIGVDGSQRCNSDLELILRIFYPPRTFI